MKDRQKHREPMGSMVPGGWVLRGEDAWGSGAFGAPRGSRLHRGVDVRVRPGEEVVAPFSARVQRRADPYDDDPRFRGLLLVGWGDWAGFSVKVFYVDGEAGKDVRRGDPIGVAQDIGLRYAGITPHLHVELWRAGEVVDPGPWLPDRGEVSGTQAVRGDV